MVWTDNIMDDFIKELKLMVKETQHEGIVIRLSVKGGDWSAALGEDIEALSRVELEGITLGWRTGWAIWRIPGPMIRSVRNTQTGQMRMRA